MVLTCEDKEKCQKDFSFSKYMSSEIKKKRNNYNCHFLTNNLSVLRPIEQLKQVVCFGRRRRCQQSYDTSLCLSNVTYCGNKIK